MSDAISDLLKTFVFKALDKGWTVKQPNSFVASRGKFKVIFYPTTGHVVLYDKIPDLSFKKFEPGEFSWEDLTYDKGKIWYKHEFIK